MSAFLGYPKVMFLDNNGEPMVGGKVYTYAGGTSTPKATYPTIADADAGTNANTNPVILDARGEATIVVTSTSYKFILKDPADSTIWTIDNYTAASGGGGGGGGSVTQVLDSAGFVAFNGTGTTVVIGASDTTAMTLTSPTITETASTSWKADSPAMTLGDSLATGISFKISNASVASLSGTAASWGTTSISNTTVSGATVTIGTGATTTNINGTTLNVGASATTTTVGGTTLTLGTGSTTSYSQVVAGTTVISSSSSALVLGNIAQATTTVNGVAITVGGSTTTSITEKLGSNAYVSLTSSTAAFGYSAVSMTLNGTSIILNNDQPVLDSSSNEYLEFGKTASAVNNLKVTNSATGASPTLSASGGDTNIGVNFVSKGTAVHVHTASGLQLGSDQPLLDSSGNEFVKWTKTASAVNEITVTNNSTGASPIISATGGDTNIGLRLGAKGSGTVILDSAGVQLLQTQPLLDANGNTLQTYTATASAVNYFAQSNAATGSSPTITATGADAAVSMNLQMKGTGTYNLLGTPGAPAALRFYEQTSNGTDYATIKVPASLAAPYDITLPTGLPPSTQYMQMSSSGDISFTSSTVGTITQLYDTASNVAVDGTGTTLTFGATDTTAITATIASNNYFNFTAGALSFGYTAATLTLKGSQVKLGDDQFLGDSSGNEQLKFIKTASAVNEWTITNAATSNPPRLEVTGGDTNITANIRAKGTGNILLTSNAIQLASTQSFLDANGAAILSATATASAVNNIRLTNAATTTNPIITATGSDTNIGLNIQCKGTGTTNLLAVAATSGQLNMYQANSSTQYCGLAAPTSGVTAYAVTLPPVAPTTGQVMYATSATALAWTGTLIRISSAAASASATIDFTGLTTTYRMYLIVADNVVSATSGASLNIRTSTNNGSSYDAGAGNYRHARQVVNDGGTSASAGSTSATEIVASGGINNSTTVGTYSGLYFITNAGRSNYPNIQFSAGYWADTSVSQIAFGGGVRVSNTAFNAIRFLCSSGNITQGTFTLYGVL